MFSKLKFVKYKLHILISQISKMLKNIQINQKMKNLKIGKIFFIQKINIDFKIISVFLGINRINFIKLAIKL